MASSFLVFSIRYGGFEALSKTRFRQLAAAPLRQLSNALKSKLFPRAATTSFSRLSKIVLPIARRAGTEPGIEGDSTARCRLRAGVSARNSCFDVAASRERYSGVLRVRTLPLRDESRRKELRPKR